MPVRTQSLWWRRWTWLFALLAAIAGGYAALAQEPQSLPVSTLVIETRDGVSHSFTVELANTHEQRAAGLMHRTEMAPAHGMLFDFGTPRVVAMWMKNTLIPLDMLFIQSDGRIANIAADTVPHSLDSLRSRGRVVAVLELNAGTAAARNIRQGDLVRHDIFGNAAAGQ